MPSGGGHVAAVWTWGEHKRAKPRAQNNNFFMRTSYVNYRQIFFRRTTPLSGQTSVRPLPPIACRPAQPRAPRGRFGR